MVVVASDSVLSFVAGSLVVVKTSLDVGPLVEVLLSIVLIKFIKEICVVEESVVVVIDSVSTTIGIVEALVVALVMGCVVEESVVVVINSVSTVVTIEC